MVVTYDLTRLQRLDTDVRYLVTLGGEHLIDPATVIERMEYEHPLYNPASVAAQARLSEIDTDRLAFAGAYHGWGFHEDAARSGLAAVERLGLEWPSSGVETAASAPSSPTEAGLGVYETTISHTRRRPWKRTFTLRSHTWLVDVDDLPDHGVLGRFEARDHLGDPELGIRENVVGYLREHGIEVGQRPHPHGRRRPAPSATASTRSACSGAATSPAPRRPPSSRCTTPTATGTPTSCTPTSRAVPPHRRRCTSRRSTAPTAPTTSSCPNPPTAVSRSSSGCAATTAPASPPRSSAAAPTSPRCARHPPPCAAPCSSGSTASCCGCAGSPSVPAPTHESV